MDKIIKKVKSDIEIAVITSPLKIFMTQVLPIDKSTPSVIHAHVPEKKIITLGVRSLNDS
ncbi:MULTISPECIES: hypothetical protein [unclassified Pseudoalteromonas]|uniref:hypothetical protein n=1 Tax=unclassified Pseudoalteromonas TaxID=194690 RepID=UPI00110985B2|nr:MULTISPECIES: hypothetical protein [unclassified Pseudoalteromonas]